MIGGKVDDHGNFRTKSKEALSQVIGIYSRKQIFWGRKTQFLKFSPFSPSSSPTGRNLRAMYFLCTLCSY